MTSLIIVMLLMLLVAVVFILLATGKQRRILKRQDENKRWYEQRLTELEEERSLHGLSDEEYEYSKQELDKTFVNDSKDIEETIEWRPAPVVLPAVIVVIISVAQGELVEPTVLKATEVLAKHDEEYMPPELAEKMKGIKHVNPNKPYEGSEQ